LRAKKSGNYIVIQMDPNYEATDMVRQKMWTPSLKLNFM
jgi:hypothetical protein